MEHVRRRDAIFGFLAAGALSACDIGAQARTAAQGSHSVDTVKGRIAIPTNPERVVAVVNYAMHALFSLDFAPVGVPDGLAPVLPEHAARYAAAPKIGRWNAIDLEQVAGLRPDLILGLDIEWNTPLYDRLAAKAPTALFPLAGTGDWARVTERYADAVGRLPRAEALKKQYQDRAAVIRTTYAGALSETRWAIANEYSAGWVLWYPDSSGGQVLEACGVRFAAASAGKQGNYGELSLEQLNLLEDADVILIRTSTPAAFSAGSQKYIKLPTFQSLKAARSKQVYPMATLFPYSYTHAQALLAELEGVLKILKSGA